MFPNIFLKSFRLLLLPVALIYWVVISIRNFLFDKKIIGSTSFGLPLICIGNLTVGGTGKSPMVECLIKEHKEKVKVAILSRGYKRKTKGFAMATASSTALEIGDEPMQFHLKFPDVPIAVCEARIEGIPLLIQKAAALDVIILDDAFQHRSIKAGLNILLTDYNNLFTRDFYLPTGDLRDLKSSYKRADIIIVTKCPELLNEDEKLKIIEEVNPLAHQHIFFSAIDYGEPYHIKTKQTAGLSTKKEVLLVSGIANPRHLKKLLEVKSKVYFMMQYPDHHIYTIDDLKDITKKFKSLEGDNKMILTTEKDAVRLLKFNDDVTELPIYVIPVRPRFLFNEEVAFNELIVNFIKNFKKKN